MDSTGRKARVKIAMQGINDSRICNWLAGAADPQTCDMREERHSLPDSPTEGKGCYDESSAAVSTKRPVRYKSGMRPSR
jgi:hypothetical protein